MHKNEVLSDTTWNKTFWIVWRMCGSYLHYIYAWVRNIETARGWEQEQDTRLSIWITLFRFLSVGYLMMLAKRVRHENWVRVNGVKGKIWGGKPAEGAVLPQRPCGLQWTPHKCLKQEGTKEVGNPVVHALVQILNICRVIAGCKLLHQEWETATRRQTVLMVKHLHKSHPMWICLSLWEKKGVSKPNREGRTERMYWELIMWFLFFSPFLYSCTVITCL